MSGLEEIERVKQLKARYFRHVDAKDWGPYREVFTSDVLFDIREGMAPTPPDQVYPDPPLVGVEAATEFSRNV